MMNQFEILTGVGRLYIAPIGTAFPAVNVAPGASWNDVGETVDGVTVTPDQTVNDFGTDQRTGAVKARRSEESLVIETKLAQGTLENLTAVLGNTVTDTPPGAGTIGTRQAGLTRNRSAIEYALLFRGRSPYGDWAAQYEIPRGYFGGSTAMEHTKDGQTSIPVEFHALEDLAATNDDETFGRLIDQYSGEAFTLDMSLLDGPDTLV